MALPVLLPMSEGTLLENRKRCEETNVWIISVDNDGVHTCCVNVGSKQTELRMEWN